MADHFTEVMTTFYSNRVVRKAYIPALDNINISALPQAGEKLHDFKTALIFFQGDPIFFYESINRGPADA
jgi:hypothetical protein